MNQECIIGLSAMADKPIMYTHPFFDKFIGNRGRKPRVAVSMGDAIGVATAAGALRWRPDACR